MRKTLICCILLLLIAPAFSQENVSADSLLVSTDSTVHEQSKFDPATFLFEHIGDSFEWHICTIGHTHITIPLPVILYSKNSGLHVFMSSKFHHNNGVYKNFRVEHGGKYDGKIVELDASGKIDAVNPTPIELSITKNAATAIFVCILLCLVFIPIANKYKRNPNKAPSGMQNCFEVLILFVKNDIAIPSMGERSSTRFMPFLLTLFFFIWFANMLGLVPIFPGGANLTGNIAATLALALFTFLTININGNKHYWRDIVDTEGVPWYMKIPVPIMPVVEIIGMFIKPTVLMIRLFANILAGHMIAMVFMSIIFIFGAMSYKLGYVFAPISLAFSLFMTVLEILVAFIQAYVFTMLSAVYIGMSTAEH